MAYKQTRRSISVSRETYLRLKAHCDETNQSMSGFTTKALLKLLDDRGAPEAVEPEEAVEVQPEVIEVEPEEEKVPPEAVLASFNHMFGGESPEIALAVDPYHVEVSRKLPKAEVILLPLVEEEDEEEDEPYIPDPDSKAERLRRHNAAEAQKRVEMIKLAAEKKAKAAEEAKNIETGGGIFTF